MPQPLPAGNPASVHRSLAAALLLAGSLFAPASWAAQTLNTSSTTSCVAQGGTPSNVNLITDFDNGTFGVENGDPGQSPSVDPYPAQVTGGVFDNFFDFDHGDYGYVANPVVPRNRFQHPDITDPVFGATGRFFASDPNVDTPVLAYTITSVVPNQNYELSFWAANSEPNGIPNLVNAVIDGIVSYSTGPLLAFPAALEWRLHSIVFNSGDRTTILLSIASTETGAGGRDFYLDNVVMQECSLVGGDVSGTIYSDSNTNNTYNPGTDGVLSGVSVQVWETLGDADPTNDIFVSTTTSLADGSYSFTNLPASANLSVRVVTGDPDLPTGATPGTATALPVSLPPATSVANQDFGFDLSAAFVELVKDISVFDPSGSGLTHAIPGNDVVYTISLTNRGGSAVDNDAIFLVDDLPAEVSFFNGDFDGVGSGPIEFSAGSSSLTLNSADVRYALAGPAPADFTACNYTPAAGYDDSVGYVCFRPRGAMSAATPDPVASVSFRARVN